jgi:hypothetical protein
MRKIVFTGLLVLLATAAMVAVAEEAKVPETITLKDCADKKAPVEFPHKAHFEVTDCVTCHHTQEGLTLEKVGEITVEKCSSCHLNPEKAETPSCSEMSTKKNPFHIACVGCHKDTVKENAESKAPTKCNDCHPKVEG